MESAFTAASHRVWWSACSRGGVGVLEGWVAFSPELSLARKLGTAKVRLVQPDLACRKFSSMFAWSAGRAVC